MYNAHWIHSLPYSKFIELTLRYSDKTDVEPGTRIEWRELGLNTGLYILHINGFSEKIFVP